MEEKTIKGICDTIIPDWLIVILILLGALCIRLFFFVGFVGGHPQDDGIFICTARSMVNGNFPVNLQLYNGISSQYIANPAETFPFRLAFVYPLAACFYLFGEGDYAAGLFPLVCSLATILIIYYISRLVFNRRVAIIAAFLCAIYPFDIIHATRVLSDETFGTLVGAALLMFLLARRKKKPLYLLLCGFMLGLAYLAKLTAVPIFIIVLIPVVWDALRCRRIVNTVYYCAGLALVILPEGLFYYFKTGSFFLHFRVISSSVIFKYTQEGHLTYNPFPLLRVEWADIFYYYFKMLFSLQGFSHYQLSGFGLFYYFVAAGMIAAVVFRKKNRAGILVFLLLLLYLYFEFAPLQISWNNSQVVYRGIYKHLHYLTVLTVPALPFAGYMFYLLLRKYKIFGIMLLCVLTVSAYLSVQHDYTVLRASQLDSRSAAAYLQGSVGRVFSDHLMLRNLEYYMGKRAAGWTFEDIRHKVSPDALQDGYVILGGGRGIEIVAAAISESIPAWAQKLTGHPEGAPPGWKMITRFTAPKDAFRKYDTSIFRIDDAQHSGKQ
jgi:4-amino-4-deoxy-L-arabinose transferase-like glycosyltransferase